MNLGKQQTSRRLKQNSSRSVRVRNKVKITFVSVCVILILIMICTGIGMGIGIFKGILNEAPQIEEADVTPNEQASFVYDTDGNTIATLVQKGSNRTNVTDYNSIPDNLINAFVAIEDSRYWKHNGVDIPGIFRAAVVGITTGRFSEGASTITQQLIKNSVFSDWMEEDSFGASLERKIQEQYLALKLEEQLSKKEILLNYLNTINLGNNTLGISNASQRYFGKSYSDLNLSECVVLSAITNNPSRYNPITHSDNNAERCEKILSDMQEQGYISHAEQEEALKDIFGMNYEPTANVAQLPEEETSDTGSSTDKKSTVNDKNSDKDSDVSQESAEIAAAVETVYDRIQAVDKQYSSDANNTYSYFTDEVIEQVISDLQTKRGYTQQQAYNLVYSGGLSIYSTLDQEVQSIIDEEVNDESYYPEDCTQYSCTFTLVVTHKDGTKDTYSDSSLKKYYKKKDSSFKFVTKTKEGLDSLIKKYKKAIMKKGDTAEITDIDYTLQPQVSFVIMDQSTGYVAGISGGRGEKTTSRSLNRATNTLRQPGSLFKVLAAFAPAIDMEEATLATTYYDASYTINKKTFSNYWGDEYLGYATIRQAIVYSMNIVSLKCSNETITPKIGFEYLEKFGFTTLVDSRTDEDGAVYSDINSSICLGGLTDGVTNLEVTAAYAAIANGGESLESVFYTQVVDSEGNVLLDNTTTSSHRVVKKTTAYLLTKAMEEVMDGNKYPNTNLAGTGKDADVENMTIAGKTGTTTSTNDIWFTGYSPYYTATIWSGYDDNMRISNAENYHKKIWSAIMTKVHKVKKLKNKQFKKPKDIVEVEICSKSGKLAKEGVCDHDLRGDMTYTEYFIKGTEPTESCDRHKAVTLCTSSYRLAGKYCPSDKKVTYGLMKSGEDDGEDAEEYSNDKEYWAYSRRYCAYHYYVPPTTEAPTEQESTTKASKIKTPTVGDIVLPQVNITKIGTKDSNTSRADQSASGDVPNEGG